MWIMRQSLLGAVALQDTRTVAELSWPKRAALLGALLSMAKGIPVQPGWGSRSIVLDVWVVGTILFDCTWDGDSLDTFALVAVLEKRSPRSVLHGILSEADDLFGIRQIDRTFNGVEVHIARSRGGAWTGKVIPGPPHASPFVSRASPAVNEKCISRPDIFGPNNLHRRIYDRSGEQRKGDCVGRWGDLCATGWTSESINNFTFPRMVCSLPYCSWGPDRPIVPIYGCDLPPGWRRSEVVLPGKTVTWEATEPIGVPLKFQAVDVSVMGIRKGPSSRRFCLEQHGFTWVRQGEAGSLEGHAWFTNREVGKALGGDVHDWRGQLWENGLRDLLTSRLSSELCTPVLEVIPLIDDLKKRRWQYDKVYREFLDSPLAAAEGIKSAGQKQEYFFDRDLDLTTSSCDQREGRITANEHIPMLLELGPLAAPVPIENISDFNRRLRTNVGASHTAAAWPAHIDLLAEGATSHLLRAAEVGSVVPCDSHCVMPDGVVVPLGVPLRREMMQCWVLRDERATCMPLALFHDFLDGQGPAAIVPELNARDVIIWRTSSVLHGALSALVHGECIVELGIWEALGAIIFPCGLLGRVDTCGKAAAAQLESGDRLIAVDDELVCNSAGDDASGVGRGTATSVFLAARRRAYSESRGTIRLTFQLPRYNGRRSIEFRFFVYWPA